MGRVGLEPRRPDDDSRGASVNDSWLHVVRDAVKGFFNQVDSRTIFQQTRLTESACTVPLPAALVAHAFRQVT